MSRTARIAPGGMAFHVLNRGVGKMKLFLKAGDYDAFERHIGRALDSCPIRICAYCLMPNHWHMVVWPEKDGQLASFMHRLTTIHVMNWQKHTGRAGHGHIYQSRFKSFPIQEDTHFFRVVKYVERNPLRAGLVKKIEDWRWSSLWRREYGSSSQADLLSSWPVQATGDWRRVVQQDENAEELAEVRKCLIKGAPFGSSRWTTTVAEELGLQSTLRDRGRPARK